MILYPGIDGQCSKTQFPWHKYQVVHNTIIFSRRGKCILFSNTRPLVYGWTTFMFSAWPANQEPNPQHLLKQVVVKNIISRDQTSCSWCSCAKCWLVFKGEETIHSASRSCTLTATATLNLIPQGARKHTHMFAWDEIHSKVCALEGFAQNQRFLNVKWN